MKAFIKIAIVFVILVSCDKTNQPDILYDCVMKATKFDSNDEVLYWEIRHYKNDNLVKNESSFDGITEYQYDSNGNRISVTSNGSRTEYEYNSDNNIVKMLFYENNQLKSYTKNIYVGTLLLYSYSINNVNDTIGYCYYYYNSADMKDSVICQNVNRYYYYSAEMDSIIIKSKKNEIIQRIFKKYESGRLTYHEARYYHEGELRGYIKTTSEFNDIGLLTRRIHEGLDVIMNITSFLDRRFFYNSNDNILKVEDYDEVNNLLFYFNYIYDEFILTKVETYDHSDKLKAYSIIENNCDNKALLPTWYVYPSPGR